MLVFLCISYYVVCEINDLIKPQLLAIATQKTNYSLTYLTQRVIEQMDYDVNDLMLYEYDDNNEISSIQYDTNALNNILNDSLNCIQTNLTQAYKGESIDVLNEVFYEEGIIHEVALGYFTPLTFLQNVGYHFKISLELSSYVNGKLRIVSEPYGLNSTLLTVYLDISMNGMILTSIYHEQIQYETSLPIIIQVVQGDYVNYQSYIQKE